MTMHNSPNDLDDAFNGSETRGETVEADDKLAQALVEQLHLIERMMLLITV